MCRTTGLRPPDVAAEDPLEALHATLREAGRLGDEVGPEWVAARFRVFSTHLRLISRYRPRPYPGPVVLVLTGQRDDERESTLAAWRSVAAGGLKVCEVSADHYSVVAPEHAAAVGAVVRLQEW